MQCVFCAAVVAKAKQIVSETGDIEVVRRENAALFKQLEENRKTAEANLKAVQDSAAEGQNALKAELLKLQRQAEKDGLLIQSLQGRLERQADESTAIDEKLLSESLFLYFSHFLSLFAFIQTLQCALIFSIPPFLSSSWIWGKAYR